MILIVDDDPLAGEMTQAILEAAGYETILAGGASEALARVESESAVDLVISDHHMPGTSGIELFRALRAQGIAIPFILLSGDDPVALGKLETDIDAFVSKDESFGTELPAAAARLLAAGKGGSRR